MIQQTRIEPATAEVATGVQAPMGAAYRPGVYRAASWSALLAGTAVALGIQTLLTVLGAAIGLSAFDPAQGDTAQGFGVGAGIWYLITSWIALFFGGWVAGWLAGIPRTGDGAMHGFMTWCVATVLMLFLVATATGAAFTGALGAMGSGMAGGQSAAQPMQGGVTDPAQVAQATGTMAATAWWSFIGLLVGAAVAAIGGAVGRPRNISEMIVSHGDER